MNFYGHAYLAAERSDDPAYLFGAMLPDFCTMVGTRLIDAVQPQVRAGVDHHHAVDEVFHAAPIFVDLMGWGRDVLEDKGVRLGPAMAVGHVGVELLLDGWLWHTRPQAPYREALQAGREHAQGLELRTSKHKRPPPSKTEPAPAPLAAPTARIGRLLDRLIGYEVPASQADAQLVAQRLRRILEPRPRLAMSDDEYRAVCDWVAQAQTRVRAEAGDLIDQVRAGLSDSPST